MKRSEFVERAGEGAANLAEQAGVRWDPEEPELPERVMAVGALLEPVGWSAIMPGEEAAIASEAAARYNTMGRLLRPWTIWGSDDIQRVLDEEREKLKEGG